MKIVSQRTFMPFDNRNDMGQASLSQPTQKSIMPFNNVLTIQDILDNRNRVNEVYPHARGNWASGDDVDKSYREKGDDYKREVRDREILMSLLSPKEKTIQRWEVRMPGGSREFMSFELARKYTREKGLPFSLVRRVAQNNNNKISVIAESLEKTLMVESISPNESTVETGSAFCVAPNYFITCAHVIKSYNKNVPTEKEYFSGSIVNLVKNDERHQAEIIDTDPILDIALLRCNTDTVPFAINDNMIIGEDIIVIGSPHGYENNVSTGTLGSLNRKVYSYNNAPDYMFVDLSVFPGNSGGPVVKSSDGSVIGMVTLIISSQGSYGLNAALPSHYILDFCTKNIRGFGKI